jgi:hypothetical protein
VTSAPYRISAPAASAASTSARSSTVRRGAYSASTPWAGLMPIVTDSVPKSKRVSRTGGVPASMTRSSTPHRDSRTTLPRMSAWVDSVSAPYRPRSTSSTRSPRRASSIAVAAPATRAPTMMTSWVRTVAHPARRSARRAAM